MAYKLIYFYDNNKQFDHSELVDAATTVPANATDIRPTDGLYEPRTFNGKWVGVTREEWLKNQPAPEPEEPTDQEQAMAELTKQLAQTKQTATDAQNALAELTKQVAQLKGADK
ncbi:hypothetical protein [Loigolactobacillus rennini]|uniref:Bacteriophage SP-beta YorD domain-containing protein n=1 Tax=Loigolactobacillus rennini DSM 20253 TaxID=1423796 RepID=A0A0R2CPB4_9LACO|nr:hypothetical protein [Loigolactobacillus rennini]KRM92786.1 hypothetical protein FC24_GL000954 [Loigolactobacillus rennini DSM 20253]